LTLKLTVGLDRNRRRQRLELTNMDASRALGAKIETMKLTIRLLQETDGRWIGDVPELPGVTVYGATAEEATVKAKALALRVIAEEIENGEITPDSDILQFSIAA
jgi:predicted RNase H-like HicB family nuclease